MKTVFFGYLHELLFFFSFLFCVFFCFRSGVYRGVIKTKHACMPFLFSCQKLDVQKKKKKNKNKKKNVESWRHLVQYPSPTRLLSTPCRVKARLAPKIYTPFISPQELGQTRSPQGFWDLLLRQKERMCHVKIMVGEEQTNKTKKKNTKSWKINASYCTIHTHKWAILRSGVAHSKSVIKYTHTHILETQDRIVDEPEGALLVDHLPTVP